MDNLTVITTVRDLSGITGEEAERVSCVVLHLLAQRISLGEAADLAERLPTELKLCLEHVGEREKFHLDEFLQRVEEQTGMDRPRVEQAVIAVLAALWRAVGGLGGICRTRLAGEYADLRSELPKDFQKLLDDSLAAAPPLQVDEDLPEAGRLTLDEFLDRVAERAGVDRERARQAAEAVRKPSRSALPAARSRIDPAGAARASACREAGVNRSRGRAMRLSLQAFLREIARLEHRPRSEATKDGRAVLAVLRESVGEKEFHDTTSQLPGEFQIHLKQETG